MNSKNINCGVHYMPVYHHTSYNSYYSDGVMNCKNAESEHNKLVSLPIYFSLSEDEQNYIIECVNSYR
jgi:dTDP-4-amino-4,6-dideoxygalactose transaminase